MDEIISISSLNQFSFCERRAGLMLIEGVWADNEHTIRGTILHEQADQPSYESTEKGRIVRSLPLYSQKYSLNGRADVVEFIGQEIVPVEYKKGKRRKFSNDDIQVAAQALCLEEMFSCAIKRGFVYHAASKKRREVEIDSHLRKATIEAIEAIRDLIARGTIPKADYSPRCKECSLINICLPKLTDPEERSALLACSD